MDNNDPRSGGYRRPFLAGPAGGAVGEAVSHDEFLALATGILTTYEATRRLPANHRDIPAAYAIIGRVFDTLETLQLRCSVLEAEKSYAEESSETLLHGAFDRIRELEDVVAGLMRLVAKYDSLLLEATGRTLDAEQRAAYAELRVRDTERGASDAVEWLYRYMTDSFHITR